MTDRDKYITECKEAIRIGDWIRAQKAIRYARYNGGPLTKSEIGEINIIVDTLPTWSEKA